MKCIYSPTVFCDPFQQWNFFSISLKQAHLASFSRPTRASIAAPASSRARSWDTPQLVEQRGLHRLQTQLHLAKSKHPSRRRIICNCVLPGIIYYVQSPLLSKASYIIIMPVIHAIHCTCTGVRPTKGLQSVPQTVDAAAKILNSNEPSYMSL